MDVPALTDYMHIIHTLFDLTVTSSLDIPA
jgi:hypothetical protein